MLGPTLLTYATHQASKSTKPPTKNNLVITTSRRQQNKKVLRNMLFAVMVSWIVCIAIFIWAIYLSISCPQSYRLLHTIFAFFFPIPYIIIAKLFVC